MIEVAIAVVCHENQFLVGVRDHDLPLAGYDEFPGGKVESGESGAEAAIRECREETGVDVVVIDEYEPVCHEYDHGNLLVRFFNCRPISVESPKRPFRWVERGELAKLKFPEANDGLIVQLLQSD